MNPSRDANRGAPPSAAGVGGAEEAPGRMATRHSVVAAALAAPGAGSGKRKSKPGSSKPSKQPKQPRPRVEKAVAGSKRKAADARRYPKRGLAGMPETEDYSDDEDEEAQPAQGRRPLPRSSLRERQGPRTG